MKVIGIEPLSFQGRITRKTFWLANILLFLVAFTAYVITIALIALLPDNPDGLVMGLFNTTVAILALLALVAIGVIYTLAFASLIIRRAHDRDSSGWLWLFFSFLLLIPWFILGLLPSKKKSNKYGAKGQ